VFKKGSGSFEKRVGNEEKVLIFQYPKINYPLKIQKSQSSNVATLLRRYRVPYMLRYLPLQSIGTYTSFS